MDLRIKTVLGIVLFAAFLGLAYFFHTNLTEKYRPDQEMQSEEKAPAAEAEKTPAPDFTVFDPQGNRVKLSDFAGRPVVLNFWASWCPPCIVEMPLFNEVYAEVKDDIAFMMADLVDGQRETLARGEEYVKEQGYDFPVYFDNELQAAAAYGVTSIPATVFIDADGYIVTAHLGAISREKLQENVNLLMSAGHK